MITYFDFSSFVVGFAFTGLKIDWLQFTYDVLMLIVSSYIVYIITHNADTQKEIRKNFEKDVQELSRYLDVLKTYVEQLENSSDGSELERYLKTSPYRESLDYLTDGQDTLHWIRMTELKIEEMLEEKKWDKDVCDRIAFDLFRQRVAVCNLALPKGHLTSHRIDHLNWQIEQGNKTDE